VNASLVLLAAGDSRRLGSPKQLLRIGNETLLHRATREACASRAREVIVVLGFQAEVMRAEINGLRARTIENASWREGIASSIRSGVGALDPSADGVLLAVCDQPRMTAAHCDALLRAADAAACAAASFYGGSPGVPAFFPRALFADLLALTGDRGAKGILAAQSERLVTIAWPDGAIDIDTAEDIAAAV